MLEVLPTQLRGNNNPISRLRAQWRANPHDTTTVAALARLYIETGREQADPRYYGYAEALLQPWWQQAEPTRRTVAATCHHPPASTTNTPPPSQDLEQLVQAKPEPDPSMANPCHRPVGQQGIRRCPPQLFRTGNARFNMVCDTLLQPSHEPER